MERVFEVIGIIVALFRFHILILVALIVAVVIFVRDKKLMLKLLGFIFIMVVVLMIIFANDYTRNIYEPIRGLQVIVVDKETGEFLPDIVIYYSLEKGQLLPSLDTTSYAVFEEKYVTGKGGVCNIPKRRYWKWPFVQWTHCDIIAVNIDVIDRIKKEEGGDAKGFWTYFNIQEMCNYDYFYNKNPKYRGEVIYFSRNGFTDLEGRHMYKLKRYDLKYMDLRDTDEIIIVRLERKR